MNEKKEKTGYFANKQDLAFDAMVEKFLINPAVSAEKLQVFVDMQVKQKQTLSKQMFSLDMVRVQQELRAVPEDMQNDQTHSTYSSYKMMLKHVKPVYTEHGFALMFYEIDAPKEGEIRVCVDVMHKMGHTEKHHTDVPLDDRGVKGTVNKTRPHAKGSSLSYGRSYLMKLIFNLSTGDDDDGNAAGNGLNNDSSGATDTQILQIKELRDKLGLSDDDFKVRLKRRFGVDCPRKLSGQQADLLIRALGEMRGAI